MSSCTGAPITRTKSNDAEVTYTLHSVESVDKGSCTDIISKCDKALEAKNEEIKQDEKLIKEINGSNEKLTEQVIDKNDKLKSPFRNPFFMSGAGAGFGLLFGGPVVMAIGFIGGLLF